MSELFYRQGVPNDIPQIKELTLQAYGQFTDIISQEHCDTWKANLSDDTMYRILFEKATCFVCELGGAVVGSAFLLPSGNPYKWFTTEWSYIRLVAVHPDYAGRGIGTTLTHHCIDRAREQGESIIALHTSEFQHAARYIYERIGFRKRNEFVLYNKKYWVYTLALIHRGITFSKATGDDIDALVEFRLRFATELAGDQPGEKIYALRYQLNTYFSTMTKENNCISIIADCDGQIAGIGSLLLRNMPGNFKNPSGKWGYIMNIYTVPEYRRQGICTGILHRLLQEGEKLGITAFELQATPSGEPAYRKCGFEIQHEPILRKYVSQQT